MKKRILSLVLALSMMISLFPVSALAQTPGGGTAEMRRRMGRRKKLPEPLQLTAAVSR